jgi:pSer/pThr/pTyr-binding forkhead associated (FHA) protein
MSVRLELVARGAAGTGRYAYEFDCDVITLGRAASCDILLPHDAVSAVHARIRRGDGSWFVCDCGSTNGTRLGNRALAPGEELPFGPGQRIEIGDFLITMVTGGPSAGETSREGTRSIARRMVREVLGALGPGQDNPELLVVTGGARGTRLIIRDGSAHTIGSASDDALRLDAPGVVAHHAQVKRDLLGAELAPLCDAPVRVAGVVLTASRLLEDGDAIVIGDAQLEYSDPAARYLRELQRQPDLSRASASASPPDTGRTVAIVYVALLLAVACAATGLWLLFR